MNRNLAIALLASVAVAGACNRENDNNNRTNTGTGTTPSGSTMNSNSGTHAGDRTTATTPRSTTPAGTATPGSTTTPPMTPATNTDKDDNPSLTTSVRNALAADTTIPSAAGLTIYSDKDGEVTVKGTVPSQDEKDRIAAKIVTLPGVKKVDNKIDVKEPKPQSP